MSEQLTLWDTGSAISSPGSASGPTPCGSPDGLTSGPCGPEAPPASRFRPQDGGAVLPTSGTLPPSGSISSISARLTLSLVSRLRQRCERDGSTLYRMNWKREATPSGRHHFRLAASARRTSASAPTSERCGWPTPTSRDHKDGASEGTVPLNALLGRAVWLAGWPTPTAMGAGAVDLERLDARRAECKARTGNGNGFGLTLDQAAPLYLSGWPTPVANDVTNSTHCYGPKQKDGTRAHFLKLPGAAQIAGPARLAASGEMRTGSTAAMGNGGRLNPAHPRWLMGLPPEFCACIATATASSPRKRRRS